MTLGTSSALTKTMPLSSPRATEIERSKETPYLIKEVLHKLRYPNVIKMPVNKQHLLQMLELRYCIVAVPGSLATLLPNDT